MFYSVSWVLTSGGSPSSMNVTTTSFTIPSLRTFSEYTVSVSAFTAIGEGMNISDTTRTQAGGMEC